LIWSKLDEIFLNIQDEIEILHGGATGPDVIGKNWAFQYKKVVNIRDFLPDWERWGKSAGMLRNVQMLAAKPDLVIAFYDGKSKGTEHTIREAHKRGIKTFVIETNPEPKTLF
jgi:ABC-type Fe3+-hydroxamate transport system substrate-binding protein